MLKTFLIVIVAVLISVGAQLFDASPARANPTPASQQLPAGALQDAASVYLRQAATQRVRWQPYSAASFAMAKRMNRPVLIDIGAMWCHWCHVMDERTYADPEVAALINRLFVPIKVDRDQRPDVDQYYQAAAAALSGNGGWPLTCFTMPDGALFAAFGFLPATRSVGHGPAMKTVLKEIAKAYRTQPQQVAAQAAEVEERLKKSPPMKVQTADRPAMVELMAGLSNAYDRANGGFSFGEGPKFFEFPGLEFALEAGFYGHPEFTAMALDTLRRMARGGVYDQLGGGFHRYSTDQAWKVPHFEKIGYDQALALSAYAHAFEISADPEFKQVALSVADYVEGTLLNPINESFYASQDADAFAGDDGGYYTWSRQEIAAALKGPALKAALLYFGLDDRPAA